MKLLYFSLAAFGLVAVEAGKRTQRFRCSDRYGKFRSSEEPEWISYMANVQAQRAAWEERAKMSTTEICEQALAHEACTTAFDQSEDGMEQIMEDTFGIDTKCGRQAEEWANAIIACQMCNSLRDIEDKEDDGKNHLQEDMQRTIQAGVDNQQVTFADGLTSYLEVSMKNGAKNGIDNGSTIEKVAEDVKAQNQAAAGPGGRSVGEPTTMAVIKTWFKKVSGGVWNVVVSGGPEYCKDMLPKYPRIKWGKMRPGNPNWYMVSEIRDNCVILHGVIKNTKCFCVYVLWGCSDWSKVKRCSQQWQRGKASIQERKYCFYFSNLKGGVWKPKRHPTNPLCKGVVGAVAPSGQAVALTGFNNKKFKQCNNNCMRRYRGNYRGRQACIQKCKAASRPPPPPPPPKKTMAECKVAGYAWCIKWMSKKGSAVVRRCKTSLDKRPKPAMHAFCIKLGLNMAPL